METRISGDNRDLLAPSVERGKNDFHLSDVTDVLWTLTDRCNLRCVYCGVVGGVCDAVGEKAYHSLSELDTERVLRQLARLPKLESIILSGGEALLSANFEAVLKRTRDIAPLRYVLTNGTTTRHHRLLVEERPRMMVTIDSTDEHINARTRGPGTLRKSLQTIHFLIASQLFTIVIMVATRHNIDYVPRTIRELHARGARCFLIQQLHCPDKHSQRMFVDLAPSFSQLSRLVESVDRLHADLKDVRIDDAEVCFFSRRREKIAQKCDPTQEYLPHSMFACGAAFNFLAIKANADVIPCNAFLDSPAGNLLQDDICDILERSPLMRGLRNLRLHRVDEIPGCKECRLSILCDGGCRADVFNLTGEIGNPHPACPHNPCNAAGATCLAAEG